MTRNPRAAFVVYALALVTASHWPWLTVVNSPIKRPDLIIHLVAFALWTILLARAGLVRKPIRIRRLLLLVLIATAYAGVDEWTQQFVHRTTSWSDFSANLVGIALGTGITLAFPPRPAPPARRPTPAYATTPTAPIRTRHRSASDPPPPPESETRSHRPIRGPSA